MNAFIGKKAKPTETELAGVLGSAKTVWDQLLAQLAQSNGANVHEWKRHSSKSGWSLRVKCKEQTIAWLGPNHGSFTVLILLGDKAIEAAGQTSLPQRLVKAINDAPRYPEGTGVRLEISSSRDVRMLKKLAAIKLAN